MLTLLFAALAAVIPFLLRAARLTNVVGVCILSPVLFLATTALLFRRGTKQLEPVMKDVERHLSGGRRELAIKALEAAFPLKRWNPLLPGQLHGQLGVLHYTFGELGEAETELAKAGRFPWSSAAFLGCVYFKKGEEKPMRTAFEKALTFGGKEPVLYTVYAYCLRKLGRTKDAIEVLERAQKKVGRKKDAADDERIAKNLELLKDGKKMKPQVYGEKWNQFQLEGTPGATAAANLPRHMRGFAVRPGFRNNYSKNGVKKGKTK